MWELASSLYRNHCQKVINECGSRYLSLNCCGGGGARGSGELFPLGDLLPFWEIQRRREHLCFREFSFPSRSFLVFSSATTVVEVDSRWNQNDVTCSVEIRPDLMPVRVSE